MKVAVRKRRHHQRSRNGCASCKKRHMRCDEGKPICKNCLTNGATCSYPGALNFPGNNFSANLTIDQAALLSTDIAANTSAGSGSFVFPSQPLPMLISSNPRKTIPAWHSTMPQHSVSTVIGASRADPFNTLPLELSNTSKMLLDHFANNRILLSKNVQKRREDDFFRFIISDPVTLHSAIFISAGNLMKLCGRRTLVEPTFYHHKAEAIRIVNERLGDRSAATSDGTVGGIAILVLVEAIHGAGDVAALHLHGLKQLIDLRGDLHSQTMNRYLHRMIMIADLLTSSATKTTPLFQQSVPSGEMQVKVPVSTTTQVNMVYYEKELGLDPEVSRMFVDLHRVSYLMEENDSGTPKVEKAVLQRAIHESEMAIDALIREARYDLRIVKGVQSNSACCVIAGYLYVYYFLRRIPASSSLFDYMVWLLKEDIENAANTVRRVMPKEALFWVLFVGASAGKELSVEPWFKKELLVSRQALRIATWEVAKFMLKKFAWVEGWNEEIAEELFDGLKGLEQTPPPVL